MSELNNKKSHLRTLAARPGDFASFVTEMKRATVDYRHPDGKFKGLNPLAGVDLSDHGNFLDGLYHSWAAVLEVLSFYQEKIAQEGYLNTATESFSIEQLVAEIGYRRPHALSAKTWLAFTLNQSHHHQQYVIPKGTRAQNIPQGGQPIVFETIDTLIGKPDWNTLTLAPTNAEVKSRALLTSASFCYVLTPVFMIKPLTHLWIRGKLAGEPVNYFVVIRDIIKVKEGGAYLFWHRALDSHQTGSIHELRLALMPKSDFIFGHDALAWQALPQSDKAKYAERFSSIALLDTHLGAHWHELVQYPNMQVYAMVSLLSGKILAAGSQGIFYSFDEGDNWLKVSDKLVNRDVFCLFVHDRIIYAGGSQGYILCSYDEGQSWGLIRGNKPLDKEAKKHLVPGLLPAVSVNALTAMTLKYRDGGRRHILFAGTVKGLFYSTDEGRYWLNGSDLFYYHNEHMPEGAHIYHLQTDGEWVAASTSMGLYFAKVDRHSLEEKGEEVKNTGPSFLAKYFLLESHDEKQWSQHNAQTQVYASITVKIGKRQSTFFATSKEVYQLIDGELVTFSRGVFRTLDACLPRVYGFLLRDNDLYMATNIGVYLARDLAQPWQIDNQIHLYTVPDPQCWASAFNAGRIPEDVIDNLLLFGFPVAKSATVTTDCQGGSWFIKEENSANIHIEKKHTNLFLSTQTATEEEALLQVNGEQTKVASSCPEQIMRIGTLYPVNDYIAALTNGQALPSCWYRLFEHIGLEIGQKTQVISQVDGRTWLIQDDTQQIHFLIKLNDKSLQLSRLSDTLCLLSLSSGRLLSAGKPFSVQPSRWPDFWLNNNVLPLSSKKNKINVGDTLLLQQTTPRAIHHYVTAVNVADEPITALGKTATVTQVQTKPSVLSLFDRRMTKVFTGERALELSKAALKVLALQGEGPFRLKGIIATIPKGNKVALVGRQALLQLTQAPLKGAVTPWVLKGVSQKGQEVSITRQQLFSFTLSVEAEAGLVAAVLTSALIKPFLAHDIALDDSAQLQVAGEQYWLLTQVMGEYYYLQLDSDTKQVKVFAEYAFPVMDMTPDTWVIKAQETLTLTKKTVIQTRWLAAPKRAESISELLEISECQAAGQDTVIQFSAPLIHYYDPSTVTFFANIALAVQGETVQKELIAMTDPGQPFQRYQLHREPLTVYQDEQGTQHNFLTLEMRLSGAGGGRKSIAEKWQQTTSILNSASHQRHYEVFINGKGKTEILFGDGKHGRIPEVGIENLFAHYRFGGGAKGNLPLGAIKLLKDKPLGVKAVFNPLPCVGGADPMVFGTLRENAPQSLTVQNVIISSDDCLHHVQQYPGVSQATLTPLQVKHQVIWVVCIDAADLSTKDKQPLAEALAQSITRLLSQPVVVKVVLARVRYFYISAKVWVHDLSDCPNIADELSHALSHYYFNEKNNLGKDVDVAHVSALLQEHASISGVKVTNLGLGDELTVIHNPAIYPSRLPASPVVVTDNNEVLGAERLLTHKDLVSITVGEAL
ncbi:hypothetical protein [uncultured Shewanella sp.]|uniref:hypothetical protein n=1 Tax=uncultured Shewanella sp. TaxID=173975 RepID=UPI0026241C0B|nr:hypothetical protein [uncultured Shewanella sp.]